MFQRRSSCRIAWSWRGRLARMTLIGVLALLTPRKGNLTSLAEFSRRGVRTLNILTSFQSQRPQQFIQRNHILPLVQSLLKSWNLLVRIVHRQYIEPLLLLYLMSGWQRGVGDNLKQLLPVQFKQSSDNVACLARFIHERQDITVRRTQDPTLQAPFTQNSILSQYFFTNVNRW